MKKLQLTSRLKLVSLFAVLSSFCTYSIAQDAAPPAQANNFFVGADLSYVNEMEDCGATYRDKGKVTDPFQLFANKGANLVRVRLWHNPDWTQYSNFNDAKKTLARAKKSGMKTLLDFHYSDTWTDPEKQFIPKAWVAIKSTDELAKTLYDYTYNTLSELNTAGVLPDLVQVGNETNIEILQQEKTLVHDIPNWPRNAQLLNAGIKAVRDLSRELHKPIKIVLHIAQPENAIWWFPQAEAQGVTDFDIIGLSYYPQWSKYKLPDLPDAIKSLKARHHKAVMIVETAYPWTLKNFDRADNVLGKQALQEDLPATPKGQLMYLLTLAQLVKSSGGLGVIYWEPAWVSTRCKTLWGTGSHWENASFFDAGKKNESLPAFLFFKAEYTE